jgi:hypothetical protein
MAETEAEIAQQETPVLFASAEARRGVLGSLRFLVSAGLINTLIASVVLARLPASSAPSMISLFVRATIYVAIGALAGTAGLWWYWRRASGQAKVSLPFSFKLFALTCGTAWVWAPPAVLAAEQQSAAAAGVAVLGASLLAGGLRRALPLIVESRAPETAEHEIFADTLRTPARDAAGFLIAGCVYAGAYAIHDREIFTAGALLGAGAFLFTWKATARPGGWSGSGPSGERRAAVRLACAAGPAVLITVWILLEGFAHGDRNGQWNTAFAGGKSSSSTVKQLKRRTPDNYAFGPEGYESIVLWPEPPKKEILSPVLPPPRDVQLRQPRVLRFTGWYSYFQPPNVRPGPHAHVAHGSPLALDIHSTAFIPLTMEAHQPLAYRERLACCEGIEVEVVNRDNRAGSLSLAMVLTDTASRGRPSQYLGLQPIASSQPGRFSIKSTPVRERLHFAIPAHAALRRFDEITLVLMSDRMRSDMGARIAIEQFELEPR